MDAAQFYLRCLCVEGVIITPHGMTPQGVIITTPPGTPLAALSSEVLRRVESILSPSDVMPWLCDGSATAPCHEWAVACVIPVLAPTWKMSSAVQCSAIEKFLLHVIGTHLPGTKHWIDAVNFALTVFTDSHRATLFDVVKKHARDGVSAAIEVCGQLYLQEGVEDMMPLLASLNSHSAVAALWDIVWLANDHALEFETLHDVLIATIQKCDLAAVIGATRQIFSERAEGCDELLSELSKALHRPDCPPQVFSLLGLFFEVYLAAEDVGWKLHVENVANAVVYHVVDLQYAGAIHHLLPASVTFLSSKLPKEALEITRSSLKANFIQHFQKDIPHDILRQLGTP